MYIYIYNLLIAINFYETVHNSKFLIVLYWFVIKGGDFFKVPVYVRKVEKKKDEGKFGK